MALLIGRRQQVHVCVCLFLLLLAVAPPAPMVVAQGGCYWTYTHVPRWCQAEFINALVKEDHHSISTKCCLRLICASNDDACTTTVLMEYCAYGTLRRYCKYMPPLQTSNSSKPAPPAPSPAGHHH